MADQQVLDLPPQSKPREMISRAGLKGIVLDNQDAQLTGIWTNSTSASKYVGVDYIHDGNVEKGLKTATWTWQPAEDGQVELRLSYSFSGNRATAVPVTVNVGMQQKTVEVNQKVQPTIDGVFVSLGKWSTKKGQEVTVTVGTGETDGHVIVDALQILRIE